MEPYGSNRAEVGRWLGIAEKLLAGGDLVGSKTFAIRARDSDPSLDAADQILAVVDTLIAGEKRINNQHDWYAILELARYTRDPDIIAAQYRRLAILLNPHRNHLAFADQAFKLVSDAWSVLSNPSKKTLYDNELVLFSKLDPAIGRGQEHHEQPNNHFEEEPPQPQQQHAAKEPQQPSAKEQQQQQQHAAARRSPRNKSKDKNVAEESEIDNNHDEYSTFWTACPYCYNMYEFPGVYEECSLRCMNCRRAFHGTKIFAPPPIIEGKEAYFCCWGFYPLGISMSKLDKNKGGVSSWNPFSPIFASPQFVDRRNEAEDNANVAGQSNVNAGAPKNVNPRKGSAPRIYIDDQDVYVEISESGEESGDEWGGARQKKKAKNTKGKGSSSTAKNVKKSQGEKAKTVRGVSGDNLQGGYVTQQFMGAPNAPNAETSRKAAVNNAKKQTGKAPKEWGRLDLNVEFSNEVEEPAPGMTHGHRAAHGEEDGIEGIGFFEGLDEFLSSLPILKG